MMLTSEKFLQANNNTQFFFIYAKRQVDSQILDSKVLYLFSPNFIFLQQNTLNYIQTHLLVLKFCTLVEWSGVTPPSAKCKIQIKFPPHKTISITAASETEETQKEHKTQNS